MYAPLIFVQAAATKITQATVLLLVAVSALFVIGLLILLSLFLSRTEEPLKYGNFFVVALGIMAVLIGYLVAFPLIISGVFSDPTQVLAILSALFGTVVGLVGTYFGIKATSDATMQAQNQARDVVLASQGKVEGDLSSGGQQARDQRGGDRVEGGDGEEGSSRERE